MLTSYAKHGFNDLAYGRLKELVTSSSLLLKLSKGYVVGFLKGWASGRNLYVTITDAERNLEICKVTGIAGDNLTVERGQDGTVAQSWPAGSLISQRLVAANLGRFHQKGEYRTVSYNPDKLLVPNYPGEKVYQDGSAACEKRWFINREATLDRWGPLAGDLCDWEYLDGDGYIQIGPWLDRTDDTYWTCYANCIAWNGTYWQNNGPTIVLTTTNRATYWAGYRPTYISLDFVDAVTYHLIVYTGTAPATVEGTLVDEAAYSPLDILALDWTGLSEDIIRIDCSPNSGPDVKITEIKFIGAYP